MPLNSFRVGPDKALRLAETNFVPRVMIVAGPNGVGKSTLLFAIKNGQGVQATSDVEYLYQGPHRVLRKTTVRRGWLSGAAKSLVELLRSGGDVSGFEGISFPNSTRTPDNVDEAGSTIKYTLGQLENRRQSKIAGMYDRIRKENKDIKSADTPDVYQPLRKITEFLLPHLVFEKIDFENEENVKCLWVRKDDKSKSYLDIDQLSSGEKAIIILFMPLLESQIVDQINKIDSILSETEAVKPVTHVDRVMLIDEPEQHLHPDLQAKLLSYMRAISVDTKTQFIMTTHSPTILDQAFDDELFVLLPPSDSEVEENQLKMVANSAEKLEALKSLAGSAYFLTTGRIIICIEGEPVGDASDISLLEILYPRATSFTLVPTTGKGNVINTVTRLTDHVPEELFRIRVRGLVDADSSDSLPAGIAALPVCMIENLLFDLEAIAGFGVAKAIEAISTVEQVKQNLTEIVIGRRDAEIKLRVQRKLRTLTIRIGGTTLDEVKASHNAEVEKVVTILPADDAVEKIVVQATLQVDQMILDGSAIERFHGKHILRQFYNTYVQQNNLSYSSMCVAVAKSIALKGEVGRRLDPIFDQLSS